MLTCLEVARKSEREIVWAQAADTIIKPKRELGPESYADLLETWEEGDGSEVDIPCDTLAAILLLKSQFLQTADASLKPVVLKSQVYSVVKDRTVVDRELDSLR